ncbi:hypothetical protein [Campylobacter majalis]|uniref:hypothetical protein n=1 Tax=Campylobacter majalis TaxID=2790656 RepID=UPI003D696171
MTEQQAMTALLGELEQADTNEQNTTQQEVQNLEQEVSQAQNETAVKAQTQEQSDAKEALAQDGTALNQASGSSTQEQQTQKELTQEQLRLLNELGIGNIGEIIQAVRTLQSESEALKAEQARRETFATELSKFKEAFPQIEPDEMAKWAQDRGFDAMLTQGFNGWSAIAKQMIAQATTLAKPDDIISTNKQGNELGAFEKMQKGEDVSDIQIGAELLKTAGLI